MQRPVGTTTSGVLRIRRREEVYRDLLTRFFILLKTAQARDTKSEAWHNALGDFYAQLLPVLEHETTLFLSERDGYLYVNAIRVRIEADAFAAQRFLVREFVHSRLSGIVFERGVDQDAVTCFVSCFLQRPLGVDAVELQDVMRERGIRHIHVLPRVARREIDELRSSSERGEASGAKAARVAETCEPKAAEAPDGLEGLRRRARQRRAVVAGRRTYFQSILIFRYLSQAFDDVVPSLLERDEVHTHLQALVDRLLGCENGRIALELVRTVDAARIGSALRVAVPAMGLARRFGMSVPLTREFGLAAMLAGILRPCGKDGDEVDPRERQQVLQLISGGGASGLLLLSALCGWEDESEDARDGFGDPSIATAVLRVTRRMLQAHAAGEPLEHALVSCTRGGERALASALRELQDELGARSTVAIATS